MIFFVGGFFWFGLDGIEEERDVGGCLFFGWLVGWLLR